MGVQLRAEVASLLGANAHPADLVGQGPIGADMARDIVRGYSGGRWRWVVTDEDGHLVHAGRTHVRPYGYARPTPGSCATIDLLVPAALLMHLTAPDAGDRAAGLGIDPATLAAWAPVLADLAAGLAAAPHEPPPNPSRRFPGTRLRRRILMGVRCCIGPYCVVPARRTEIDHLHPRAEGGPTVEGNLAPECRTEHRLKTRGLAHPARTGPHAYTWTTRLGATRTVPVPPVLPDLPGPAPTTQVFRASRGTPLYPDWRTDPIWDPPRPPPRRRRPRRVHWAQRPV